MQQATRIADYTAFFLVGEVVEYATTDELFTMPKDKRTEDYLTKITLLSNDVDTSKLALIM